MRAHSTYDATLPTVPYVLVSETRGSTSREMFRATSRRGRMRRTRADLEEGGEERDTAEEEAEALSRVKRKAKPTSWKETCVNESVEYTKEVEKDKNEAEYGSEEKESNQVKQDRSGDGLYHGLTSYKDYRAGFRRENTAKASNKYGPKRAPENVRRTVLMDYQPDICKDYKETGYCGYGDSCKFLHDRGDYKLGWQLDRDWEEKMKKERELTGRGGAEEEEEEKEETEEELPFACLMCRTQWKDFGPSLGDPVVTRCQHHFCEHCALKQNAISKKCFVCDQPTLGMFNTAHEILKKYKVQ